MNRALYEKVKALYDRPGTPGEKLAAKAALDRILAGNEVPPEKHEAPEIIHEIYTSSPPISDDEMSSILNCLKSTRFSNLDAEMKRWKL